MATKVKPGQIWKTRVGNARWKITKISFHVAYGRNIRNGIEQEENEFADLTNDDEPTYWSKDWELESEPVSQSEKIVSHSSPTIPAPTSKSVLSDKKKELDFFTKVASGNCPCNTPRAVCPYHKD